MRKYLCDTGPLLCFASFPEGPQLFRERYEDRIAVVGDVDADLAGLSRSDKPKVARAAVRANGKAFRWIPRVTIDSREMIDEVLLIRDVIDTFRDRPKGNGRRPQEDMADAAAIVWAKSQVDTVLIMNDTPARRAARAQRVDSISTVDVLEAMVRDGSISDAQRVNWLRGMGSEIDAG